ncbi:hypothetical protein [Shinella kummerowiae]|uniref:hypothetical protein n=1 Tax=Shinella kummerowiae TaxID=417745 RepID=UPI0021B6C0F6|nr:hypothetical protein [Shinella kummerowiae]MCT7667522.1 hypothetical protein [Shinella kummerowiae]
MNDDMPAVSFTRPLQPQERTSKMLTYQEAGIDTDDRLAMLARQTKLLRHDANLSATSGDVPYLRKRSLEGEEIEKLEAHLIEYLAFETHKTDDPARQLAEPLRTHVKAMGRLLSQHVGDGPAFVDQRRAVLERAAEYTCFSPHKRRPDYTNDNSGIANALNKTAAQPARADMTSQSAGEGGLRRKFQATSARHFTDMLGRLEQSAEDMTRRLSSLYADASRDDITAFRHQPALGKEIARLAKAIPDVKPDMAAAWPQQALPRTVKLQAERAERLQREASNNSFLSDLPPSQPAVHRLKRRHAEITDDDQAEDATRPARRAKLTASPREPDTEAPTTAENRVASLR